MLAALMSKIEPASPLDELRIAAALTAAALLFLQFLSSGRYESLSGRIGIDCTMGFHRIAAIVLLVLALLHPLGYVAGQLFNKPSTALHHLIGMLTSKRLYIRIIEWDALRGRGGACLRPLGHDGACN